MMVDTPKSPMDKLRSSCMKMLLGFRSLENMHHTALQDEYIERRSSRVNFREIGTWKPVNDFVCMYKHQSLYQLANPLLEELIKEKENNVGLCKSASY